METTIKKKSKPKCFHCKKKLKLTELDLKCKCKNTYCNKHLKPHTHKCTFDYVKEKQDNIRKNNPKMCDKKIDAN